MVADTSFVHIVPDGLDSNIAAPLLCAGLSLAGTVGNLQPEVKPGDSVAIIGAGGGLGHLGVQLAATKGYKVIAIDGGEVKGALCRELGAYEYVDYTKEDVSDRVLQLSDGEGVHAVIIVAGSENAYEQSLQLVRNCGVLVCVGLPQKDFKFPAAVFDIVNRGEWLFQTREWHTQLLNVIEGLVIKGSSTGTKEQMEELFELALKKEVLPRTEVYEFEKTDELLQKLIRNEVAGRLVVRIP
jgi:propanol-preferring alcohol dehydrogenase